MENFDDHSLTLPPFVFPPHARTPIRSIQFLLPPSIPRPSNYHLVTSAPNEPIPSPVRTATHPLSLSTILNPVSVPREPWSQAHEQQAGLPPPEYRFITPYRTAAKDPRSKYRMYADDYSSPPIKARIESRLMSWDTLFFTVVCDPRTIIIPGKVLAASGELDGRWVIEEALCKTLTYLLVRIKENRRRLIAVLAIPRAYINIPDPEQETQKIFEKYTQATTVVPSLRVIQQAEEWPWNNLAVRPVGVRSEMTALPDPHTSVRPRYQWVDTIGP